MSKQHYTMNNNIIEAIKARLPIQDTIVQYVPEFKRRGRRWWACCPLHGEKTPSLMIDIDKQVFRCYGCSQYGDVIDFIAKITGRTNAETIYSLADELGVSNTMTEAEKRKTATRMQQKKKERQAREKLQKELDSVFLCLCKFEKSCRDNLNNYEDYERYPASVELQPIVSELLDEYLTEIPEKQIAVWRYIKGRLPWLLTY